LAAAKSESRTRNASPIPTKQHAAEKISRWETTNIIVHGIPLPENALHKPAADRVVQTNVLQDNTSARTTRILKAVKPVRVVAWNGERPLLAREVINAVPALDNANIVGMRFARAEKGVQPIPRLVVTRPVKLVSAPTDAFTVIYRMVARTRGIVKEPRRVLVEHARHHPLH
jgi:hypothetical protein